MEVFNCRREMSILMTVISILDCCEHITINALFVVMFLGCVVDCIRQMDGWWVVGCVCWNLSQNQSIFTFTDCSPLPAALPATAKNLPSATDLASFTRSPLSVSGFNPCIHRSQTLRMGSCSTEIAEIQLILLY